MSDISEYIRNMIASGKTWKEDSGFDGSRFRKVTMDIKADPEPHRPQNMIGVDGGWNRNRTADWLDKNVIQRTIEETYFATETTVAASDTLIPATRTHILTAASAVTLDTTTAIQDGLYKGQMLILVGTDDTNTVTINTGANTHFSANRALGDGDTLMLVWDGTNWLEVSFANN